MGEESHGNVHGFSRALLPLPAAGAAASQPGWQSSCYCEPTDKPRQGPWILLSLVPPPLFLPHLALARSRDVLPKADQIIQKEKQLFLCFWHQCYFAKNNWDFFSMISPQRWDCPWIRKMYIFRLGNWGLCREWFQGCTSAEADEMLCYSLQQGTASQVVNKYLLGLFLNQNQILYLYVLFHHKAATSCSITHINQ